MCGIAGIAKWNSSISPEDIAAVERMMHLQKHRGPDDSGVFHDSKVVFGHRRLSIIDLSPAAHQPLSNEDGTIWVIFNGEIYNYRELRNDLRNHEFKSASDTEVLVHGYEEWGIDGLLSKLRGMFAFAIYDCRASDPKLLLARDRLGIKPLYYHNANGDLAFASECKTLLSSGLCRTELNPDAIAAYLLFGSVPSPITIQKNLWSLPAGHYLLQTSEHSKVVQYWDLHFEERSLTQDLYGLLEDSIRLHMISDVPVGLFLSGGLDSGALLCLEGRTLHSQLRTLTLNFSEQAYNESEAARLLAGLFGAKHEEVHITAKEFIEDLPKIFHSMDQPTHDGVNTYFISKAAKAAGLKVVLSGLGGDEVFWGYRHYRWLARGSAMHRFLKLPASIRRTISEGASVYGQVAGQERWLRFSSLTEVNPETMYFLIRGFFSINQTAELLGLQTSAIEDFLDRTSSTMPAGEIDPKRFNYLEMKRYLHDQLLRDTDTFSMTHSIEVRVPFLDHKIVEAVFPVDGSLKIKPRVNKPLLVGALSEPSLRQVSKRRKKGFSVPMSEWMKQCVGQLEETALQSDFLDRKTIRRYFQEFHNGRLHWSRAWSLAALGATQKLH